MTVAAGSDCLQARAESGEELKKKPGSLRYGIKV